MEAVEGSGKLDRRCLHLTFDDGFRELHDVVAPILLRKGIPATFFVNSAFIDNKIPLLPQQGEHSFGTNERGFFQ